MLKRNFLILFMFLLLMGCASNNSLRLLYSPSAPSVLPLANAPSVVVVLFEDKRTIESIGEKRDGAAIATSSVVSDWVSRYLAEELSRLGLKVSFAPNLSSARSANPDFIVTGAITEVWVKENNPASYAANITISYTLANKKGTMYSENISSNQERGGLPGNKLAEDVLSECLRNVLTKASNKIYQLCLAK